MFLQAPKLALFMNFSPPVTHRLLKTRTFCSFTHSSSYCNGVLIKNFVPVHLFHLLVKFSLLFRFLTNMHQHTSSHCDSEGMVHPEAWKLQEIMLEVKEVLENQRVN